MALCCSRTTRPDVLSLFFFFNDTATTEIYTLSLHDALPICARRCDDSRVICRRPQIKKRFRRRAYTTGRNHISWERDRKSTRLNSSHQIISYAVFCLKKKKSSYPTKTHTHTAATHNTDLPTT